MRTDTTLPPILRLGARRSVLDITEFYGPTSGGVRTYLGQKAAWVAGQQWARQAMLVPGDADAVDEMGEGSRRYSLRGPRVPGQPPYRFLLAPVSARRIMLHERSDIIELGSPGFAPWIAAQAARGLDAPMIAFFHPISSRPIYDVPVWIASSGYRSALTSCGSTSRAARSSVSP